MRNRILAFLLAFFVISSPVLAQAPIKLSIGHVLGQNEENYFVEKFSDSVSQQIKSVQLVYKKETADAYGAVGSRFDKNQQLCDVVFVYCGKTELLDEVSKLASEGRLQPADALPDFAAKVKPEDFYPNLIEPVTFDGHLWAVPLRPCVPFLMVTRIPANQVDTWDGLEKTASANGFHYYRDWDFYPLWLSLLEQRGIHRFKDGQYVMDNPGFLGSFNIIQALFKSGVSRDWDKGALELAIPDVLPAFPAQGSTMTPAPLPAEGDDAIYPTKWCWYLAVSGNVTGPGRGAACDVLAAATSPTVQLKVAKETYSPPVRPSIAQSSAFRQLCAQIPSLSVQSECIPRLRFRKPDSLTRATEEIVEKAFLASLQKPESFMEQMTQAVASANALVTGK